MKYFFILVFIYIFLPTISAQQFDYEANWKQVNEQINSKNFASAENILNQIIDVSNKNENYYQHLKALCILLKYEVDIKSSNNEYSFENRLRINIPKSNNTMACIQKHLLSKYIREEYEAKSESRKLSFDAATELENKSQLMDDFNELFKPKVEDASLLNFLVNDAIFKFMEDINYKKSKYIDEKLFEYPYFSNHIFDANGTDIDKILYIFQFGLKSINNKNSREYANLEANRLLFLYDLNRNDCEKSYEFEIEKLINRDTVYQNLSVYKQYLEFLNSKSYNDLKKKNKLDSLVLKLKSKLNNLQFSVFRNFIDEKPEKNYGVIMEKSKFISNEPIKLKIYHRNCQQLKIKIYKSSNIVDYLMDPKNSMDPNTYETKTDFSSIITNETIFDTIIQLNTSLVIDTLFLNLNGYEKGNYYISFWIDENKEPTINRYFINNTIINNLEIDSSFQVINIISGLPIPKLNGVLYKTVDNKFQIIKKVKLNSEGIMQTINNNGFHVLLTDGLDTLYNRFEYYSYKNNSSDEEKKVIENDTNTNKKLNIYFDKPKYFAGDTIRFWGNLYIKNSLNCNKKKINYKFPVYINNQEITINTDEYGSFNHYFALNNDVDIKKIEFNCEYFNTQIPIIKKEDSEKLTIFLDSKNYSIDTNFIKLKGIIKSKLVIKNLIHLNISYIIKKNIYSKEKQSLESITIDNNKLSIQSDGTFEIDLNEKQNNNQFENEYEIYFETKIYNEKNNTLQFFNYYKKITLDKIIPRIHAQIPEKINNNKLLPLDIRILDKNESLLNTNISFEINELQIDDNILVDLMEVKNKSLNLEEFKKISNGNLIETKWLDQQKVKKKWILETGIQDFYLNDIDISSWNTGMYRISIQAKDENGNVYNQNKYFTIHNKVHYPFLINSNPINIIIEDDNQSYDKMKVFIYSIYDSLYLDLYAKNNKNNLNKNIYLNHLYKWEIPTSDCEDNYRILIRFVKNGNYLIFDKFIKRKELYKNLFKIGFKNNSLQVNAINNSKTLFNISEHLHPNISNQVPIEEKIDFSKIEQLPLIQNIESLINTEKRLIKNYLASSYIYPVSSFAFEFMPTMHMEKIDFVYPDGSNVNESNFININNENFSKYDYSKQTSKSNFINHENPIITIPNSKNYGYIVQLMTNDSLTHQTRTIEIPKLHCFIIDKFNNQLLHRRTDTLNYSIKMSNTSKNDLELTTNIIVKNENDEMMQINAPSSKLNLKKGATVDNHWHLSLADFKPGIYDLQIIIENQSCHEIIKEQIFIH